MFEAAQAYLRAHPLSHTNVTVLSEHGTYANLPGRLLWAVGQRAMMTNEEAYFALLDLGFTSSQSEELLYQDRTLEEAMQWLEEHIQ